MKKWLFACMAMILIATGCSGNAANTGSTSGSEAPAGGTGGSAEKVTIALAHSVSDSDTSHYHQFATKFKEIVETESGGNVTVDIHPNGSLGGERELTEGVELGTIDVAIVSTGPLGNFTDLTQIMDFPFLFDSSEHAHKVLDGEIGEEINGVLAQRGLKVLAWLEGGFSNTTNNKHPIKKPEDFEGLLIRAQENAVHMDTFNALGAKPTPMALTEVFTALQQGVVDGQANVLPVIVPSRFYEIQKYYTQTELYYISAPVIMNETFFNGLAPETQELILSAAATARDHERQFVAEMNEQFLQTIADAGVEMTMKDELDLDAFKAKVQGVYENYQSQFGEYFDKINALK